MWIQRKLFNEIVENLNFDSLQWRHNGHDGVSNHQPHEFLLNLLFRRRSKKTSKFRVTGLCAGNSPVTGEFPVYYVYYICGCPSLGSRTPVHSFRRNVLKATGDPPVWHSHVKLYDTYNYTILCQKVSVVLKCVKRVPQNVLKRFGNYF